MEGILGWRSEISRDNWSYKRIEASSKDMEYLLNNAIDSKIAILGKLVKTMNPLNPKKIADCMSNSLITSSFTSSFTTPKWGLRGAKSMKAERAQFFIQESRVYQQSMLDQMQVTMLRTDKHTNARMVQQTQYGFVDPVYSSDGKNAGLTKSVSTTVQISPLDHDESIMEYILSNELLVTPKNVKICESICQR